MIVFVAINILAVAISIAGLLMMNRATTPPGAAIGGVICLLGALIYLATIGIVLYWAL